MSDTATRSVTSSCRMLFVNSGLLGHRSVASLFRDAIAAAPGIEARHVDAGDPRSLAERALRRVLCASVAPRDGAAANLDLQRLRSELHTGLTAARRIHQLFRDGWRPDVLHFHTQAAAYCSLRLMRDIPAIVSIDCTQTLARQERRGTLARATYAPNVRRDGRVFDRARAIVVTSEWAAADLRREYPAAAHRVRVMAYPVRIAHASARWVAERRARALRGDPVRFAFVGGDFPRKGGWLLLDAWREAALGERATLDLVTGWPVPERQLPPGVRVRQGIEPYSPEWQAIWEHADVFVMPTHAEAFGMVFQEAAAAGLPAIGTRVGAVPEIVSDGTTGVLIEPRDTPALATAIRTLASNGALRERLGRAAHDRAIDRWNLETYGRTLGELAAACSSAPMTHV